MGEKIHQCEISQFQFLGDVFDVDLLTHLVEDWHTKERGSFPSPIECIIIFWVFALMWKEMKEVYEVGLFNYMSDLWNLADCFTNTWYGNQYYKTFCTY